MFFGSIIFCCGYYNEDESGEEEGMDIRNDLIPQIIGYMYVPSEDILVGVPSPSRPQQHGNLLRRRIHRKSRIHLLVADTAGRSVMKSTYSSPIPPPATQETHLIGLTGLTTQYMYLDDNQDLGGLHTVIHKNKALQSFQSEISRLTRYGEVFDGGKHQQVQEINDYAINISIQNSDKCSSNISSHAYRSLDRENNHPIDSTRSESEDLADFTIGSQEGNEDRTREIQFRLVDEVAEECSQKLNSVDDPRCIASSSTISAASELAVTSVNIPSSAHLTSETAGFKFPLRSLTPVTTGCSDPRSEASSFVSMKTFPVKSISEIHSIDRTNSTNSISFTPLPLPPPPLSLPLPQIPSPPLPPFHIFQPRSGENVGNLHEAHTVSSQKVKSLKFSVQLSRPASGLGLDLKKGVDGKAVIKLIQEFSPALLCNPPLSVGDIIVSVNCKTCATLADVIKVFRQSADDVEIEIERQNK